jgi:hypothetical protein
LLQVYWEHDPNENTDKVHTIDGQKDALGVLNQDFSLKSLLGSCVDFDEEETMLQSMGRKMGALIDRTLKYHPDFAGEGIKYSWGCAKHYYQRLPLEEKRKKEKFLGSRRKSMSREVLSQERIVKFLKQA